ncbi:hypothetical protein [Agromyces salentinus]|uniref:SbsA Ig-like domain-containing protein n=1 Tax=Agromyces salentinus TaxID=269421 RepID=A0ABN2MQB6_9MICO|nr:hypothetical protein [Agromyces salentinus]
MSSDPAVGAPVAAEGHRFRRRLLGTIGALAVAATALGVAGFVQGPRLAEASVDVQRVTRLADGRVELELNQAIARVDGVLRVEPEVPAELSVEGDALVVEFTEPLPYDTEFHVAIDGVVGSAQPTAVTVEHGFRTADAAILTLVRRSPDGLPDAILRSGSAERTPEAVIEAPRLQSFAQAGDAVVAVAIEDDGSNTLRIAGLGEQTQTMGLVEPGEVHAISGSTTHPLIAYLHQGLARPSGAAPAFSDTLFTLDVSGQPAEPEPVVGLDGSPMRVADWRFVPGTTSMVVQDLDGALSVVDAFGLVPPRPLGSATQLRGFLPGTQELIVADPDRGRVVDLRSGTERPNDLPIADLPDHAHPSSVTQLDADGAHLLTVLLAGTDGSGDAAAESLLALVDDVGTQVRYSTGPDSRMLRSCVAPNGHLVAVETAAVDALPDGYPEAPSSRDRLTSVIDIATGELVLTQPGGSSDWCA